MIRIICVGKIKEKYLKDAIEEYSKRLSKYTKLEIIEIDDGFLKTENDSLIEKVKEEESLKILKVIEPKDYVILCAINGKNLDSVELSNHLSNLIDSGENKIDFVIGGSYGVSDEVYKRSNYKLSFSKLTFPHQLFRVMLLEQIYRSYKIMKNERYHK